MSGDGRDPQTLAEETLRRDPNRYPTPEEFVAEWDERTPEAKVAAAQRIIEDAQMASACFTKAHDSEIEFLRAAHVAAEAEVERLREQLGALRGAGRTGEYVRLETAAKYLGLWEKANDRAESAERETARLRAQVEAVRALHVPDSTGDWCDHCWTGPDSHGNGSSPAWPCATIRALADVSTADSTDTDATPAADTDEAGER